ncbi:dihydrofolate reductase [Gaetbulibacter saemankumensis]|uniref:dihydrofolate reductase n=1 Tax=Gaetbulibacter saemankumensis TaxID=311208 RepID=UPI000428A89B|nr:dihydrofolate reductase [Gaetbulibacter saemankumensis]
MFNKKKSTPQIDKEQLELLENAQKRIKQKKRLYAHFIIFLIGSVILIIANTVLGIGKEFTPFGKEWFLFAILIWFFILLYHTFNVFITNKFMGKEWEKKQLDKLMVLQQQRIKKMREDLRKEEIDIVKNKPTKQTITLIAATAENNAIGKDNKLIWHLSDDLKHFKNLTNGHHIIMGRKTFESFPKPLPNRTHIVITRQENYKVPDGVIVVNNLEDAIDAAKSDLQPYIIGGGEIYKQALDIADKIELTRVHDTFEADTFFPEIDPQIWKETSHRKFSKDEKNDHDYSFITYERK